MPEILHCCKLIYGLDQITSMKKLWWGLPTIAIYSSLGLMTVSRLSLAILRVNPDCPDVIFQPWTQDHCLTVILTGRLGLRSSLRTGTDKATQQSLRGPLQMFKGTFLVLVGYAESGRPSLCVSCSVVFGSRAYMTPCVCTLASLTFLLVWL